MEVRKFTFKAKKERNNNDAAKRQPILILPFLTSLLHTWQIISPQSVEASLTCFTKKGHFEFKCEETGFVQIL